MVSGKAWQAVDQNPIVALHAAMGLGPTNRKSLRYELDLAKTDVKYGNPGTARQWVLVVLWWYFGGSLFLELITGYHALQ